MNPNEQYKPPEVWAFDEEISGNRVDNNRPIAGPTFEKALAVGEKSLTHCFQKALLTEQPA